MNRLSLLLSLPLATAAVAQSVVVPNAVTPTTGGLNTIVRNAGAPRTYMMGINASELAAIPVGDVIVGLSFRQYSGATTTWPPVPGDALWTDYEVSIGPAIPTATMTTTFATNFLVPPTLARDGAMLLPAGTYPAGANPNGWGEFYFDLQTPVPYLGGDLGILMTHPGSSLGTNCFLETSAVNAAAHGVSFSGTTFQAATGASAAFYKTRIHYGYGAGCPGTGGLTPVLVQNGDTTGGAGGTIQLSVANAPAGAPALMVYGFGRIASPLPNGCTLLVPPLASTFFLLDANGRGSQSVTVPPGLVATFNAQAVVIDAGGVGGYTSTNGVQPSAL